MFISSSYGASGGENEPMDKEDPLRNPRYIVFKARGSAKPKGGTNMIVPPGKRHSDYPLFQRCTDMVGLHFEFLAIDLLGKSPADDNDEFVREISIQDVANIEI